MTSSRDILTSAKELIKLHGFKGASDHAADRIATLLERKDMEGVAVWRQIRAALLDVSDIRFPSDAVN